MSKKLMIGLTVAAVIGIGTYAFGHMGGGYGYMHGGSGMMHQGYYGEPGYDYRTNLKDEDIKALEEERLAFLTATDRIRQNLYSKELELRSELYKENPDAAKAGTLQKEISELQSELDQKRVDHMIKMRKLSPNDGRGFMMGGYHMGYGSDSPEDSCWR
jgi:hypothetical protein